MGNMPWRLAARRWVDRICHVFDCNLRATRLSSFEPLHVAEYRNVAPYTMTTIERVIGLVNAIEYIVRHNIPGDIVECGTWRGGSMMAAANTLIRLSDTDRKLWLFDTFEGMTPPSELDESGSGQRASDKWNTLTKRGEKWAYSSLEEVKSNMRSVGYPSENIEYVKGPVEETLPANAPTAIALLRLDTDWYESTRHELMTLMPQLAVGGVLIIDDYGAWKGARKAVDDYFADSPTPVLLNRIDNSGVIGVVANKVESVAKIANDS